MKFENDVLLLRIESGGLGKENSDDREDHELEQENSDDRKDNESEQEDSDEE